MITTIQIIALLLATWWSLFSNVGDIDYFEWLLRRVICKHPCMLTHNACFRQFHAAEPYHCHKPVHNGVTNNKLKWINDDAMDKFRLNLNQFNQQQSPGNSISSCGQDINLNAVQAPRARSFSNGIKCQQQLHILMQSVWNHVLKHAKTCNSQRHGRIWHIPNVLQC